MAKKRSAGGPNKAQLIRDYMKDNPQAGPKDVADAVNNQHGLKLSAQYVSTIKALDKKAGKKKLGRPKGSKAAAAPAAGADVISSLLQAKKLADAMGGVANAKMALDALAKLGL
jgi:hypothetical protein